MNQYLPFTALPKHKLGWIRMEVFQEFNVPDHGKRRVSVYESQKLQIKVTVRVAGPVESRAK